MQTSNSFMLAVLVTALVAAGDVPESPRGLDFVTCGCLDGTLIEFCSSPCDEVALLCEEACRGYGSGTLFTACTPGACSGFEARISPS